MSQKRLSNNDNYTLKNMQDLVKNCKPLRYLIPQDKKKMTELGVDIQDWQENDVFSKIKLSMKNKHCCICGHIPERITVVVKKLVIFPV